MGNTSYYTIPYPEQHDIPDGAGQMKAIADQVEKILHDGFTIPNGNFKIGGELGGGDTATRYFALSRKTGVDILQWRIAWYNNDIIVQGFKNDAPDNARSSFVFGADGSINAYTYTPGVVGRPVPFAIAATTAPLVITSAASATVAISHPAGRFTQSPICTAGFVSNGNYFTWIVSGSTTSCTVGARHFDNSVATYTGTMWVQAIQMTPSTSPGFRMPQDDSSTHLATCRTDGCMNAEIPLGVLLVDEDTSVFCGVCGQPIEDVAVAK